MKAPDEVVIPREYALFRLDAQGCWRNADGKFKNKKIIDYFHQAIGRDSGGYFVSQDKGGIIEKIYFPYDDTAIFVFDIVFDPEVVPAIVLVLNTGKRLSLNPKELFVRNDNLYIQTGDDTIKFSERALMKISARFEETGEQLQIRLGDALHPIPQH